MPKVSHLTEARADEQSKLRQESSDSVAELPTGKVGWICDWTEAGVWVDFSGNTNGPLLARSVIEWQPWELKEAVSSRGQVLLVFEGGDSQKPIVTGALKSSPVPQRPSAERQPVQLRVDGERLEVAARDEIALRCGEASITLRRNGRVVIKGAYVETRSRGTNRIKGGNVQIN